MENKIVIYKNFRIYFSSIFSLTIFVTLLSVNPTQTLAAGGGLDPTFSSNGKVATDFNGETDMGNDVAIQADGKIVVVGGFVGIFKIARYHPNGLLDTTFDGDGRRSITVDSASCSGASCSGARAVAIQSDGKIVILGGVTAGASFTVAALRLNPNGSSDTTFGTAGFATFSATSFGNDIALQPDGKILLAMASNGNWRICRLNTNGAVDTTFGVGGFANTDFGGNDDMPHAMAVLPDGKILVAGYGSGDFALARYTTTGVLDSSFGTGDGRVLTDFSGGIDAVYGLAVQSDGKIVVAGSTTTIAELNFALARYNANGSLDTTFSDDGKAQTNINSGNSDIANDVAIQSDGKILLVGGNNNRDFVLARYIPDGSLDTNFGNGGIVFTDIFSNDPDTANAIAIQPDGRIVVAGTGQNNANPTDFAVARYLPNGINPFDFEGDGKTDLSIFRPSNGQWWINRSSNGSTVAGTFGQSTDKITPGDFTGDGKTDIAFFRPSTGSWFVLRSEDSSFYSFPFGVSTDVPVVGDFDGDGKADPAVFRPSTATWYINRSSGGTTILQFGANGDVPVVGDYDGDGKADVAISRPSNGQWWINRSSNGTTYAFQFGSSTDKVVPGDYTGDGKTDVAIWRPSTGGWFILRSEDNSFYSFPFGANGDIPAPGDYDGDGKLDPAIFRPSAATWYAQRSTAGTLIQQFGANGDKPVPSAFVP